jgi:hypothetical protein
MPLAISSIVTPSGRCSIAMTAACFEGPFVSECGFGSGKSSIADHS